MPIWFNIHTDRNSVSLQIMCSQHTSNMLLTTFVSSGATEFHLRILQHSAEVLTETSN